MTQDGLEQWARSRGARAGGARALARFLLARAAGRPLPEPPSRALLAQSPFAHDLPPADVVPDPDGTLRFAVRLGDGTVVETVIIHQPASDLRARERWTVCVSSQVGCARGCVFCETGRIGLKRNLRAAGIVSRWAMPVLREPAGFGVPERRSTVSTVGIVPRMEQLYAGTKAQVAVSLHAIDPAQRLALLPVARKWSLGELRAALARAPRTVLLQWTLIDGVNDGPAEADALARFCEGLDVRVNLIPLNPGPVPEQRAPPLERCRAFQKRLSDCGIRALLRLPHGRQVGGACGQLAGGRRVACKPAAAG